MTHVDSSHDFVSGAYKKIRARLDTVRARLDRPLTLAEKILYGHLDDPAGSALEPGKSYLRLRPDRVAMQDATAQMALLQFMQAGREKTAVPTTVHCDHLILAHSGAGPDLSHALQGNREVYEFLSSVSAKYGIGFWKPGAGIIHQVVLEHYAFPGGMMIGTDSHTPNAGGLGMFASGVGGADAVDVMAGFPWELLHPRIVGVRLTGSPTGWTSPKDVILKLLGILTVKGGTNRVIEYFGPGTEALSCTGKATITNMGAELGATTSLFPYDGRMEAYLRHTDRDSLADLAGNHTDLATADKEVEDAPERFFDRIIEIDLSTLEPHVVGPHSPDLARTVTELSDAVAKEGYPDDLRYALIGSCTNSSYEDMGRAAQVAEAAARRGMKMAVPLMITPGSEQVRRTIERDGLIASFEKVGATVLANACGPCIGQWKRDDIQPGERNAIISSFNRNFPRRNDGNPTTLSFLSSPEIVMAYGLAGRLSFNPLKDALEAPDGTAFRLDPPGPAADLPECGFVSDTGGYAPPPETGGDISVQVKDDSDRLQLLDPFPSWDGKDFERLPLLLKAKGKCTTDHISPAGHWLAYRGHLDKISDNMFSGAVNAFTGESGRGENLLTGEAGLPFPEIARSYKASAARWVVVGDDNYGEGSSREHAAMSPRHLGCAAVIARSFARIHETNLKKQGVLPLTFADPSDYDKVRERDHISLIGLSGLAPGASVKGILHHEDESEEVIDLRHGLNAEQIGWFRAGSALNTLSKPLQKHCR